MIQESKEQQQMYNLFRSFIYIFLIIELVMHMPVHTGSKGVALPTLFCR